MPYDGAQAFGVGGDVVGVWCGNLHAHVRDGRCVASLAPDDPENGCTHIGRSRARTRFVDTPSSGSPPPTEKTKSASDLETCEPRSHSAKVVSQPSSLALAVSSATLSVGVYASNWHILRKSLTAWEAWAADRPTPRTKSPAGVSYTGKSRCTTLNGLSVNGGQYCNALGKKGFAEVHGAGAPMSRIRWMKVVSFAF